MTFARAADRLARLGDAAGRDALTTTQKAKA
jgi:hypothetical protein